MKKSMFILLSKILLVYSSAFYPIFAIEDSPAKARLNTSNMQNEPHYWMRLINILSKGLDVCALEGKDKKAFMTDINQVMESPIKSRTSLEKIRFSRTIKRSKSHDGFANNAQAQSDLKKIEKYLDPLITREDYYKAIAQLLGSSEKITDKRGTEIIAYLSKVAHEEDLSENDKDTLRNLIQEAMKIMPAYQEELEDLLNLLNRKSGVIEKIVTVEKEVEVPVEHVKIIREQVPTETITQQINLKDVQGAGSRRTGHLDIQKTRARGEEEERIDRAERIRRSRGTDGPSSRRQE